MQLFDRSKTFIYLDGLTLKAVRMTGGSKNPLIEGAYYRDISGLDEVGVQEEITTAMRTVGSSGRRVSVIANSKFAITKALEIPSFDEKEIKAIADLQASRHTPYSREEIITGHVNLETVKERYTKSLLVITPQVNVEKHLQYLQMAGLEIESVHMAFEALTAGLVKLGTVQPEDVSALIFLGLHHTDFIVLHLNKPFFVRSVAIGARQLADGTRRGEWLEEIKKSHDAYLSEESIRPVRRVLIAGPQSAGLAGLAAEIGETLGASSDVISAADTVPLSAGARQQITNLSDAVVDDLCFAAWAGEGLDMDMIPSDFATSRAFRKRARQIMTTGVLSMVIFVLLCGVMLSKVYFKKGHLAALDRSFAIKNDEAEKLVVLSEQNRLVREFQHRKPRPLAALTGLEEVLPGDMYLNEFNMDTNGHVSIKGTSEFMSSVFSFVTNFESSSRFQGINTDYAKSRKLEGKDVTDFGLSADLEEGA